MFSLKYLVGGIILYVSCSQEIAGNTIGNMSGKQVRTHVNGRVIINGNLIAQESINVSADVSISGNGYLEAPLIELTTYTCTFMGTINCSKKCIIRTQKPFDETLFTMIGDGKLEIIVKSVPVFDELINEHVSNITRGLLVMTTIGVLGYKLYKYGTSKC